MSYARPKMVGTSVSIEKLELRRLQEKVERLFSALEESIETEESEAFNSFSPTIDLCETKDAVIIAAELPGIKPEEINLTVTAKDIYLEGEKRYSPNTKKAISHFCCERQYGKFRRRIKLRWAININESTAELKNGTLLINLPKLIERRGKSIKIPIKNKE